MKDNDFGYFLMLIAGCCLVMDLYYPSTFLLVATSALAILAGIVIMISILFPTSKEKE